ncbi:MAG: heme ABC transporter ATP-binding protein [Myxococcota bacterium]
MEHLGVRRGGRWLIEDLTFCVHPGEVLGILGPNGAGKSTLLRCLAGTPPSAGTVRWDGKPLGDWSARDLALRRAVVSQKVALSFPFTAFEVVLMGRIPHYRRSERPEDRRRAWAALRRVGAEGLAERSYPTLSGGEQQRIQFARALAQLDTDGPRLLLLDEPTASLDLLHQHHILALAQAMAKEGVAVVVVLHDLNLAAMYTDRLLLIRDGQPVARGRTQAVLTAETIHTTFGVSVDILRHPAGAGALVVTHPSTGTPTHPGIES